MSSVSRPNFLSAGITIASFCDAGNVPSWNDALHIRVMNGNRMSRQALTRKVGAGSSLQHFAGEALIVRSTISGVQTLNELRRQSVCEKTGGGAPAVAERTASTFFSRNVRKSEAEKGGSEDCCLAGFPSIVETERQSFLESESESDQSPTCRLCQRLLRNLFLNSYRSTWLKTTYFRSFNPVSAVIIQLSRLYSACSPTFIPSLTVEMLHCSLSLTSVPHLTRLTTLSCWRDCLRLSVWADKPTRGSTRTSLADLNPCGWGTLHHLGHRSVSVFLKDRYSGQSCTSSIPPMLPGLSNHSGSRFTCTPTTLKSTVPAVSHDRSSYPNFSFSSLAGLMTGCRLTVFVSTRIRRNLSGSVLDTSCLTSTLVQSLSSLHRHRFAIWVWCLILNWQWRDISPNYVSRASSSFVASGPSVIHSLAMHYLLTLVHAFISSRLDFCNSVLYGVSAYLLDRLQSILNAAARLILKVSKFDHISDAMRNELHWLPIAQRINFKICHLVRNCLAGTGPMYLSEFCNLVSSEAGRRHLRSAARSDLVEPRYRLERYGRRGFSVAGPHLWNILPPDIRNFETGLDTFKKRLKTFFNAAVADSASEVSMHQRRYTNTRYYYYYYYFAVAGPSSWNVLPVGLRSCSFSLDTFAKHLKNTSIRFSVSYSRQSTHFWVCITFCKVRHGDSVTKPDYFYYYYYYRLIIK